MSELLFKICALGAISSLLILLIKKWGAEMGVLLKVASGIAVAALCFGSVSPIIEYVREIASLAEQSGIGEAAELLLRVLAVATVTHISANICRDCGEATLSSYVEFGGKAEIIVLCLPMIRSILDTTLSLL
jgi:stage III sporulation protein AD